MEEDNIKIDEKNPPTEIKDKPEVKMAVQEVISATYKGPLPPPNIMRGYDDICPGAAKMILDEFQANSEHVREMERMTRQKELDMANRGQIIATVFGFILFAIVTYSLFAGHVWIAGAGIITALVSVITAF